MADAAQCGIRALRCPSGMSCVAFFEFGSSRGLQTNTLMCHYCLVPDGEHRVSRRGLALGHVSVSLRRCVRWRTTGTGNGGKRATGPWAVRTRSKHTPSSTPQPCPRAATYPLGTGSPFFHVLVHAPTMAWARAFAEDQGIGVSSTTLLGTRTALLRTRRRRAERARACVARARAPERGLAHLAERLDGFAEVGIFRAQLLHFVPDVIAFLCHRLPKGFLERRAGRGGSPTRAREAAGTNARHTICTSDARVAHEQCARNPQKTDLCVTKPSTQSLGSRFIPPSSGGSGGGGGGLNKASEAKVQVVGSPCSTQRPTKSYWLTTTRRHITSKRSGRER